MGPALKALGAFKGQEVPATPLIRKLRIHMQTYMDSEEFYVSPLLHQDVILGAPWFHRLYAQLQFPDRVVKFSHLGKEFKIQAGGRGSSIPIVSNNFVSKVMKKSLFEYLIYVKDSPSPNVMHNFENGNENDNANLHLFLQKYDDCFADSIPNELPPARGDDDHRIELVQGSSPPNRPPYRVSLAQQEEIMAQVNELLDKGMVRPSSSPYCSPVLLVQKKDGSYRMCVDYCALNKNTIKNHFSIPRIEGIFDKLQGSSYYSRIDLKSGYHQIRIVPEDIPKTAFQTQFGLYEFLVMPFGLTNAPATFNRLMDKIFRKHRMFTGVFFDDIIVYSRSLKEHKEHLAQVFDELKAHKLYINMKKSKFFCKRFTNLVILSLKKGFEWIPRSLR